MSKNISIDRIMKNNKLSEIIDYETLYSNNEKIDLEIKMNIKHKNT